MSRRVRKAKAPASEQLDLVLAQPGERATALGRERDRMLKEIARRRKELGRAEDEIDAASEQFHSTVGPFIEQQSSIEREIHALFAVLLAPGRLTKRKHAQVRNVYTGLQQAGLIEPNFAERPDEDEKFGNDDGDVDSFDEGFGGGGRPRDAESASKPPDDGDHRVLRTLFKRLVVALHPDRVRHEDEKAWRTAAMKDVTRAYETGDLARMIELGARLSEGSPFTRNPKDPELAVETLERTVVELKVQLRELLDELRQLRRSERFRAAKDLERVAKVGGDPFAMLKKEEQARLDDLLAARDFVAAFHAGKMSWSAFLDGPSFPSDAVEAEDITEMLEHLLDEISSPRPARRRNRRRGQTDSVPSA